METFICANCGTVIKNRYEQFRERIEYVDGAMKNRPHVLTNRLLCRSCVEATWNAETPPTIEPTSWRARRGGGRNDQADLFGQPGGK